MMQRLLVALVALAALQVGASPSVVSAQSLARPVYVVRTAPPNFPPNFRDQARNVIENCCGPSVHAALNCPDGQQCEEIFIDDSPRAFEIQIGGHADLRPYGKAAYFRRMKDDQRQGQVLDWLRALVKCDDVRNHGGAAEDPQKLSAYCQVCQLLFDTQISDLPPTKKSP